MMNTITSTGQTLLPCNDVQYSTPVLPNEPLELACEQANKPLKTNSLLDKEIQKSYNKAYYENNKLQIKNKLNRKETCLLCGRSNLNHQNIPKHQQTKMCIKNRARYAYEQKEW